jgi:hypothetical protein
LTARGFKVRLIDDFTGIKAFGYEFNSCFRLPSCKFSTGSGEVIFYSSIGMRGKLMTEGMLTGRTGIVADLHRMSYFSGCVMAHFP